MKFSQSETDAVLSRSDKGVGCAGKGGTAGPVWRFGVKLAHALVQLANEEQPPLRFVAGADAVATVEKKAKDLLAQVDAHRELSDNLAIDAALSR